MQNRVPRSYLIVAFVLWFGRSAIAQPDATIASAPPSSREIFLAIAIGVIMLCGFSSFLLLGRVSERTHVALALIGVLVGGFSLLVLFGSFIYTNPIGAAAGLLLLAGMFKLMSQLEGIQKPNKKRSKS